MAGSAGSLNGRRRRGGHGRVEATTERRPVQIALIALAVAFMLLFLVLPLITVFAQAFSEGVDVYLQSLLEREAQAAILLTLTVAAIAVPLNVVFGICAAWAVAKFDFKGKAFLITLIDLPFSSTCCCSAPAASSARCSVPSASRSCLPCRASSSPRSSSPSRSLRASSSR
jgi:sulfate/thiosulfate transport system permease protein